MSDSLAASLRRRLAELAAAGQQRTARQVQSLPEGRCIIDGQELINFGSNDYLGLAHHPQVCSAFAETASRQSGSTASSLIVGRSPLHAELEQRLAEFEQCEAALLFPTGFAANLGTIQALVRPPDIVFSEQDNHASLIDAVRGSKASVSIYRRSALAELAHMVESQRNQYEHGFLITDGVFSMDGTVAPMKELSDIARRYGLAVIVDEAHGTGVLGAGGRGACEYAGVQGSAFVHIGTLSKAMGCLGGFAAGSHDTIEWLRNRARPQFFSTALPPAVCATAIESLNLIESEPERRQVLQERNQFARTTARELGLTILGDGPAPIVPVIVDEGRDVTAISDQLQQEGWFVPGIRPPTVPPGTSRFRISLTVDHDPDDIRAVLGRITELIG